MLTILLIDNFSNWWCLVSFFLGMSALPSFPPSEFWTYTTTCESRGDCVWSMHKTPHQSCKKTQYRYNIRQLYLLWTLQIVVPTIHSVDSCTYCRQYSQLYLLQTGQIVIPTVDGVVHEPSTTKTGFKNSNLRMSLRSLLRIIFPCHR